MPEQRRPFSRFRSGLLALTLTAVLGDPHVLLAPRAPVPHTASATTSAEEREAAPRRGSRRGRDRAPCPRTPRRPRSIIPHPRCHFD
ncbi:MULTISPECIES: hypothetical protein [Nocardiopsis]|uniref:Uncharacterized protein n=1 Tax=Nocardiopsis sinuspersici TaxID=501010 RepID=A0A1V3C0N4_9ACTN|nr:MULTISPECIES: hypothetical protein [Nocardiopsis]NYH50460.1 hypothetical protein [Nocardiopsis sinuspersici]OOC54364.1 hypothetical protein NOSIN_11565 [Nocardiopsis sinuspersici]